MDKGWRLAVRHRVDLPRLRIGGHRTRETKEQIVYIDELLVGVLSFSRRRQLSFVRPGGTNVVSECHMRPHTTRAADGR